MRLVFRPLLAWEGELTRQRQGSPFDAGWMATLQLLEREADHLGGREVVLQVAASERDMRLDGGIRADARPTHPGVVVSFEGRLGPMRFATDVFDHGPRSGVGAVGWQSNVRAIALGLEALRRVDRYGITKTGEQYRGWQALPPGTPMPAAQMTIEEAARLLHGAYPDGAGVEDLVYEATECHDRPWVRDAYRMGIKRHHPDQGGDPAVFRKLTEARDLLLKGAASG